MKKLYFYIKNMEQFNKIMLLLNKYHYRNYTSFLKRKTLYINVIDNKGNDLLLIVCCCMVSKNQFLRFKRKLFDFNKGVEIKRNLKDK